MSRIFVDPQLDKQFARRGFVSVPFLDEAGVGRLREVWQTLGGVDSHPFSATVMNANVGQRLAVNAVVEELSSAPIARLLDGYRFTFGNFLVKRPGVAGTVPLHQDGTWVDEERGEPVNFWIAVSPVRRENGCLRLMPGSHRLNRAPRGTNRVFPYPHLAQEIHDRYLIDVELPAGWACASNLRTFHESGANRSGTDRIAASALAVPANSELRYLYQRGREIDMFEVDDLFGRTHVYGAPPSGRTPAARMTDVADPVDSAALARVFREAQSELSTAM